ncbi:hypothetical protein [Actinoplanes sp. NPDC051494]|uniref:hypothetical protein n=1 Tax=Actinoplanes sp. NPDC051494 TaxID=3363907 RepID=UPI0037875943
MTGLAGAASLRKLNTPAIEGMHAGIIVFMGLVCFGLIMLGADSVPVETMAIEEETSVSA